MMLFVTKLHTNVCSLVTTLLIDVKSIAMYKNCEKDSAALVFCERFIGAPVGNYLFVWPLPEHITLEASLWEN